MQLSIIDRQCGIGKTCRGHIEGNLNAVFGEYSDGAADRPRRGKRRLRDHREKGAAPLEVRTARPYVLRGSGSTGDGERMGEAAGMAGRQSAVVARMSHESVTPTASVAAMCLHRTDLSARMFQTSSPGGSNAIRRRSDEHIGWIGP